MQNLAVQKGELDTQLSDRKNKLAKYKKAEQKAKVAAQKLHSVISKHKEGKIRSPTCLLKARLVHIDMHIIVVLISLTVHCCQTER